MGRDFPYRDGDGTARLAPIAVVVGREVVALEGVRGHLRLFDVANPDTPALIGSLLLSDHTGGVPMRVLVVQKETAAGTRHFALVAEINAGVALVDLQQVVEDTLRPPAGGSGGTRPPAVVGLFPIPGGLPANPAGLVPYRGDALYLDIQHGLFRLDLSNLPAIRGTLLDTIPSAYRLTVVEDFQVGTDALNQPIRKDLAIVGTVTGVTVVDLTTGQPAGSVALAPGDVTTGLVANPAQGLLFVAAGGGGFKVVDLRDPARPTLLGESRAVGVTTGGLAQDGVYAYLASGPDGVQIVKYDADRVEVELFDGKAYGPTRDGSGRVVFASDPTTAPAPAAAWIRDGALADGVSLLVLKATLPPAERAKTWQVTFRLTEPLLGLSEPDPAQRALAFGTLIDYRTYLATGGGPSLVPAPEGRSTELPGSIELTVPVRVAAGERGVAVVIYRPPAEFIGDPYQKNLDLMKEIQTDVFRSIRLKVIAGDDRLPNPEALGGDIAKRLAPSGPLMIGRPPLLLVHGFISAPKKWQRFARALPGVSGEKAFQVITVDYSRQNHESIVTIMPTVRRDIRNALCTRAVGSPDCSADPRPDRSYVRMKGRRLAATRADLVGHSIGGLVTRAYVGSADFRRPGNYFQGDLRRVITLDTPYKGSSLAEFVWYSDFEFDTTRGQWVLKDANGTILDTRPPSRPRRGPSDLLILGARALGSGPTMEAYLDLQPESPALKAFEAQRPEEAQGPGVHAVRSITAPALPFGSLPRFLQAIRDGTLRTEIGDNLSYALMGALDLALEPDQSDLIVCLGSQSGGLAGPATTEFSGLIHGFLPDEPPVQERVVKELLNEPTFRPFANPSVTDLFDFDGMPPRVTQAWPPPRISCR